MELELQLRWKPRESQGEVAAGKLLNWGLVQSNQDAPKSCFTRPQNTPGLNIKHF
jgi:hypothetical protein